MRGENEFKEAWENRSSGVEAVKGTYFGTSPLRRIVVCLAGPLFNMLFAVVILSIIWGVGFEVQTLENRIVLASDITATTYPADEAGLKTGDRIIEINGRQTNYSHEVQENIVINPDKLVPITVDRQGEAISLMVKPALDKSSGAGRIGVLFWADPVIADIIPDSDAAIAGLLPGDRITAVNGIPVTHTMDVAKALEGSPSIVEIDYVRGGVENKIELVYSSSGRPALGIIWPRVQYRTPALSPPGALSKGIAEGWKTLTVSLKSLSLLFKGIDLTEAVSGPVRITYMVGEVATDGFEQSFGTGLRSMAEFLALISVALCVMNLLPLPVLDGGQIILFIVEIIRRKPIHPRAIGVFQTIGVVLICGLMIFALFGDILYLVRR
jgi:regulator of sigma E protease